MDTNTDGEASSSTNKFVLELVKQTDESMGTGHASPAIPQVDDIVEEDRARYSFGNVDDVMDTLKETVKWSESNSGTQRADCHT